MFVSVDGKAKEVKELFIGGSDGLAHKVNEAYGSVDGIAKLVYNGTPREPNGFDEFTWAEIKELADNGLLLNYFKRFDRVDIKLTQPLIGYDIYGTTPVYYQDMLPMVVSEICETGMRLVSSIATPYRFGCGFNELYAEKRFPDDATRLIGTTEKWGMFPTLYKGCKAIDDALPIDMREVLRDFSPLYKFEYYTDDEGKQRILEEYDDCRVRQITSNGYSYHQEFVEERNRNEYILDTTYFVRTETGFKKYIPDDWKWAFNRCYGIKSGYHKVDTTTLPDYWIWTVMWQDPDIGWLWDWEDYWGTNEHHNITHPVHKLSSPDISFVCPEVQIGEIAETLDDLE